MTTFDEVRQTIGPFLERVRSIDWIQPRASGAPFGIVESSLSKWMRSIEASRWDYRRIEWRNQFVPFIAKLGRTDIWNVIAKEVYDELNKAIPNLLGGTPKQRVLVIARWDLFLAWQSIALRVPADWPYLRILEAHESGWLVGGPVETVPAETASLDALLLLEVAKNRAALMTD